MSEIFARTAPFPSFSVWMARTIQEASDAGVVITINLHTLYELERAGNVVDLSSGQIVCSENDRVRLTPSGEALAIIASTGFLDE